MFHLSEKWVSKFAGMGRAIPYSNSPTLAGGKGKIWGRAELLGLGIYQGNEQLHASVRLCSALSLKGTSFILSRD